MQSSQSPHVAGKTDVPVPAFSDAELVAFANDGYIIVRDFLSQDSRDALLDIIERDLTHSTGPLELEADVAYPGAPGSREATGGMTIRRLKNAVARSPLFTDLILDRRLVARLQQLMGPGVVMPMAHHNCVMTKHPSHSSDTGWHQDVRYWSFARQELISVWFALGEEYSENGGLSVIPGSHRDDIARAQLDDALFLREDLPENKRWLDAAVGLKMNPGDLLFFHARTFHSASRNYTDATKYSVVFTFRPQDNPPIPKSRSAAMPEWILPTI